MKDGALLIVVSAVVVGGIGWMVAHMGASHPPKSPVQSPSVIVQPRVEDVKHSPEASSPVTPKGESGRVTPHNSKVMVVSVVEPEVGRTAPIVATGAAAPAAPATAVSAPAAPAAADPAAAAPKFPVAAAPRFPAADLIVMGTDKPQIKELFGDPALSAMTTNSGHELEAFVYARDRGQAVTLIRFEDGKVTATTPQRTPFSPTNLQATAVSPTQVDLTWTNNAEDATAVLVELETTGSSARFDLGPARTLTNTTVFNLHPNTTYTFRVRAQNAAGYSGYSRQATVTLALPSHSSAR